MTTVPSLLRRGRNFRNAMILALAGVLSGCGDEPERSITAPDQAALSTTSSGAYPPTLDPLVRNPPLLLAPGKTYRIWYFMQNNAPTSRSYWLAAWEGSGQIQIIGKNPDLTLAPGESRWVYLDVKVASNADATTREILFDAHDMAGDSEGYTRSTLQVKPDAGAVVAAFTGGEHHTAVTGQQQKIRLWLYNPLSARHTICFKWMDDEGVTPAPSSGCREVNAQTGVDTFFTQTPSTTGLRRQTLQVYSLADPALVTHVHLKTTALSAASPPRNFWYGWEDHWQSPTHDIPLQSWDANANQDRQYVQGNFDASKSPPLQFGSVCDLACLQQFAADNPGHNYIVWDEPGQAESKGQTRCATAAEYADFYHRTVHGIRAVDPSARFSSAGFEGPNSNDTCVDGHFTTYADRFLAEYRRLYSASPSMWEWRYNLFVYNEDVPNLTTWKGWVSTAATWSEQNGAPMVLTFGLPGADQVSSSAAVSAMRDMKTFIEGDSRIVAAAWWTYQFGTYQHRLADASNNLTVEGCEYRQWITGQQC